MLFKTLIVIKPKGYLYSFNNQGDCYIGVQALSNEFTNEYRLGSIFLRNFYTGLDYRYNALLIGLNNNGNDAEIHGHSANPYSDDSNSGSKALIFVLLFLALLIIVAILCYLRAKKIERERTITFEK